MEKKAKKKILCLSFNQDKSMQFSLLLNYQGCFAVGTDKEFMIYGTNPLELTYKRGLH